MKTKGEFQMRLALPALLAGAFIIALTPTLAQTVIVDPAPMPEEEIILMPDPAIVGPPTIEDARLIAMANGVVVVEDVDRRWLDGNFEVEGRDAYGEEIEVVIDAETGAVLDISS
jgi:hypothetical protein